MWFCTWVITNAVLERRYGASLSMPWPGWNEDSTKTSELPVEDDNYSFSYKSMRDDRLINFVSNNLMSETSSRSPMPRPRPAAPPHPRAAWTADYFSSLYWFFKLTSRCPLGIRCGFHPYQPFPYKLILYIKQKEFIFLPEQLKFFVIEESSLKRSQSNLTLSNKWEHSIILNRFDLLLDKLSCLIHYREIQS